MAQPWKTARTTSEEIPSNAIDLALFLESDRMGYLLDVISPAKVDGQRDVVKNERRQSYENRPYGKAYLELPALLYPVGHPYSWTVIGSMEDLTAASHQDVTDFFKNYYIPSNASLCIAGDIDLAKTRAAVEKMVHGCSIGQQTNSFSQSTGSETQRRETHGARRQSTVAPPDDGLAHSSGIQPRQRRS